MKEQLFRVISVVAIISYGLPLFIVLGKQLWRDLPFRLFSIYWMVNGIINLLDQLPLLDLRTREILGVIYNFADIPAMLVMLWFTTVHPYIRRFIVFAGSAYILLQTVLLLSNGINYDAMKYSLGIGLVIVIIAITWNIIRYLQKMEHTPRQRAMLFIYAALLFEYGTFVVIYIFDYFISGTSTIDNFLIYYISSLIAIGIACYGLLLGKKKHALSYEARN